MLRYPRVIFHAEIYCWRFVYLITARYKEQHEIIYNIASNQGGPVDKAIADSKGTLAPTTTSATTHTQERPSSSCTLCSLEDRSPIKR